MMDFRRLGFSFISSTHPRRVSVSISADISRSRDIMFSATLESLFCHFRNRKVNGQPPFPLLTMFPNLRKNQSVNGTSKCLTLFLMGIGVGNFRRF
ncbi:hypothetical protein CDL15_Pgr000034 [Punica granatum]|uniref:Uncharacterized protein n=1 Tax=Punica granatum TaxID=22663 RepID=A0A218VRQ7_PUNGR|nr:hypothetical protein CDL15_Pgr000034 [Punica granatum]